MTTMTEVLDAAVDTARWAKEQSAAVGQRNLPTTIVIYRGQQLISVLDLPMNRDDMLTITSMAVAGYEADVVALVMETWHGATVDNPLTGKPWESGEMQDAADNHDAIAKGWLTDAILTMAANRAGDQMQELMPYQFAGRKVRWLPLPHAVPSRVDGSDKDIRLGGYIPDALRDIMNQPGLTAAAHRKGFDLSGMDFGLAEERVTAHRDCAVTKMMIDPPSKWRAAGFPLGVTAVIGAKAGSVRDQVIRESLPTVRRIRRDW